MHAFKDCVTKAAVHASKVTMETTVAKRLGAWLPATGAPRNPWNTCNGIAPWRVPNVFKGTENDVCDKVVQSIRVHDPSRGQHRVVLLGPSGCGKTYVLRSLPGLLDPPPSTPTPDFRHRYVVVSMDFFGSDYDGGASIGDLLVRAFVWKVHALMLPSPRDKAAARPRASASAMSAVNDRNYNAVLHPLKCFLVVRLYLLLVAKGLGFIPSTAEDYYLTQLTKWAGDNSAAAFRAACRCPADAVARTLDDLAARVGHIVLEIDEAGVAAQLQKDTFLSHEDTRDPRGLLGAVLWCSHQLPKVDAVVLAGTTLRLQHCETLGSGQGKPVPLEIVTWFPTMSWKQSLILLNHLLKVPHKGLAEKAAKVLAGKGRYLQVLWERFDVSKHGTPTAFLELALSVRADQVEITKKRALEAIRKGA